MDDIVLRGMVKWPDVPAVYGWLSLDRRGNWLIKGESIGNPIVSAFIGRNYERDREGRWFFQNGAQRVYVALDYTPFVYRVVSAPGEALALESHTGQPVTSVAGAWIDERGAVLVESENGVGVVLDRDLESVLPAFIDVNGNALPEDTLEELMQLLQQARDVPLWLRYRESNVKVESIRSDEVRQRFSFVSNPAAPATKAACA